MNIPLPDWMYIIEKENDVAHASCRTKMQDDKTDVAAGNNMNTTAVHNSSNVTMSNNGITDNGSSLKM